MSDPEIRHAMQLIGIEVERANMSALPPKADVDATQMAVVTAGLHCPVETGEYFKNYS